MRAQHAVLMVCLLSGIGFSGCLAPSAQTGGLVGDLAPAFALTGVDGEIVSTDRSRGNVTVIDFMGANCSTCHLAMRALVPLHEGYAPQGVVFYSVDVGANNPALGAKTADETRAFRDRYGANWSFALDTLEEQTAVRYEVIGLPTAVVIDRNGVIAYREQSVPTEDCLGSILDQVLEHDYAGERPEC